MVPLGTLNSALRQKEWTYANIKMIEVGLEPATRGSQPTALTNCAKMAAGSHISVFKP